MEQVDKPGSQYAKGQDCGKNANQKSKLIGAAK